LKKTISNNNKEKKRKKKENNTETQRIETADFDK